MDYAHLVARAGNGGNGCTAFWARQGKGRGAKGVDGGSGGHGGSVILEASTTVQCYAGLPRGANAKKGANGSGSSQDGRRGADR